MWRHLTILCWILGAALIAWSAMDFWPGAWRLVAGILIFSAGGWRFFGVIASAGLGPFPLRDWRRLGEDGDQ